MPSVIAIHWCMTYQTRRSLRTILWMKTMKQSHMTSTSKLNFFVFCQGIAYCSISDFIDEISLQMKITTVSDLPNIHCHNATPPGEKRSGPHVEKQWTSYTTIHNWNCCGPSLIQLFHQLYFGLFDDEDVIRTRRRMPAVWMHRESLLTRGDVQDFFVKYIHEIVLDVWAYFPNIFGIAGMLSSNPESGPSVTSTPCSRDIASRMIGEGLRTLALWYVALIVPDPSYQICLEIQLSKCLGLRWRVSSDDKIPNP